MKFCIEENYCKSSGIYIIRVQGSLKAYIGSSVNLIKRFTEHKNNLKAIRHPCVPLQRAWSKYGEDRFSFEILEFCEVVDLLNFEQKHIDTHGFENLYNLCPIAYSKLNVKHTLGSREKMSKRKGGKSYPGVRFNMSRKKWIASAYSREKSVLHLGVYDTEQEAIEARKNYDQTGRLPDRRLMGRKNTSGFPGVSLCKKDAKWSAEVRHNKKKIYLGAFPTPEEANYHRLEFLDLLKQMEAA